MLKIVRKKLIWFYISFFVNDNCKYRIAHSLDCPVDLLEVFSDDDNWFVRWGVATNPNCPVQLLEELANREDGVYCLVAENPNCPQYLKEYLNVKNFIRYYGNQF